MSAPNTSNTSEDCKEEKWIDIYYLGSWYNSPYRDRFFKVAYAIGDLNEIKNTLNVWEQYLNDNRNKITMPYREYVKFCMYCRHANGMCIRHKTIEDIPLFWANITRAVRLSRCHIIFNKEEWMVVISRNFATVKRPNGLVFQYNAKAGSYWYLLSSVIDVLKEVVEYLEVVANDPVNNVIAKLELKIEFSDEVTEGQLEEIKKYFDHKYGHIFGEVIFRDSINTLYELWGRPLLITFTEKGKYRIHYTPHYIIKRIFG